MVSTKTTVEKQRVPKKTITETKVVKGYYETKKVLVKTGYWRPKTIPKPTPKLEDEDEDDPITLDKALDIAQTIFDVAGFISGLGNAFDGANAVMSLKRGRYLEAAKQ